MKSRWDKGVVAKLEKSQGGETSLRRSFPAEEWLKRFLFVSFLMTCYYGLGSIEVLW